ITQGERTLGEIAGGTAHGMDFTHGVLRIGETVVPPLIARVKERADDAPWTILDSPPGATCPVVETMKDVDYVVLVTEPTPFGHHDLALALKLARALGKPCGVVINRALPGRDLIDHFCEQEHIEVLAHIPFRREVAAACAEGAIAIDVDQDVAAAIGELHQALRAVEVAS
ncbi:(4Fe-4S)-binding protein, partial [bacterium]